MPVNVQSPILSESPLLEGYQLLVEDIEYSAVQACTDVAKLVKILRVLRSSQLGFYPHLIEFTENRIRNLNPNHIILKKESPNIWSMSELQSCSKYDFTDDLSTFYEEESQLDRKIGEKFAGNEFCSLKETPLRQHGTLCIRTHDSEPLPLVTHGINALPVIYSSKSRNSTRIESSDFAGWDKYDPETEMVDADLKDTSEPHFEFGQGLKPCDIVDCSGLTKEERERLAQREKEKGNEAYRCDDLDEAITFYNRSISVIPSVTVINNRAQTFLKQEKYQAAARDCEYVLSLDPGNLKAFLRLATVCKKRGLFSDAKQHYQRIHELGLQQDNTSLCQEIERSIKEMDRLIYENTNTISNQQVKVKRRGPIIEIIE